MTSSKEVIRRGGRICVPVGTIAQAWRSPRQVRLAQLLKSTDIEIAIMTPNVARDVGLLCERSGHNDVVDVHLAFCAMQRGYAVVTSDPVDLSRVDAALPVITV
jgi:ribosomal protein S8E